MAVYRSSYGCLSSNFIMAMALVGFALLFQILLQCLGAFFGMSMREFNLEKEHTPATNETKSLDSMNLPILEKSHSPAKIVTKDLFGLHESIHTG